MIKTKSILLSACALLLSFLNLKVSAQNGTVSSGGDVTSVNGSASYSVGQVNYITTTGSGGTITQGLQQPYEISIVSGIENDINLSASVYPNPTANQVTLNTADMDVKNLSYCLLDVNGKQLSKNALSKKQTSISMTDLAVGTYFIQVLSNNKEIKTFKIIKNS